MTRRFCEMQNLLSISMALPEPLRAMTHAFLRRFRPNLQGTLITDGLEEEVMGLQSNHSTKKRLDEETALLLVEWKSRNSNISAFHTPREATYRRSIRHNGSDLKPGNVSFPDSLVVVGTEEIWSAARIESIFDVELYPKEEKEVFTLLKVQYFAEMTAEDTSNDVYRRFDGMGRVVYLEGDSCKKEVVPVSSAISHFAMTEMVLPKVKCKHAHILPLFRVGEVKASTLLPADTLLSAALNSSPDDH